MLLMQGAEERERGSYLKYGECLNDEGNAADKVFLTTVITGQVGVV